MHDALTLRMRWRAHRDTVFVGVRMLLAWSSETFMLSAQSIWVRDVTIALSMKGAE